MLIHSNVVHGSDTNDSDRFRKHFYDILMAQTSSGGHMKRKPIDVG